MKGRGGGLGLAGTLEPLTRRRYLRPVMLAYNTRRPEGNYVPSNPYVVPAVLNLDAYNNFGGCQSSMHGCGPVAVLFAQGLRTYYNGPGGRCLPYSAYIVPPLLGQSILY